MISLVVLWWTAGIILSLWMLELWEFGMLVFLAKLLKVAFFIEFASQLSVKLMSCVSCMVSNGAGDALQTVALLEIDSLLTMSVVGESSFLLIDEMLDLSELTPQVLELSGLCLDVEVHFVGRLKSFWVWIRHNFIRYREVMFDVHNGNLASLSEEK